MNAHVDMKGGELPGLKALIARMAEATDKNVLVGLPAGAKAEEDGTSVVLVGAVNEFGSPEHNIPERSWLRGGIRRGLPKIRQVNQDSLRKVVRGEMTIDQAVNKTGVIAVGEVKREFTVGQFKPLRPATIAARKRRFGKKSTRPLIASGNLRQEVTYILEGEQSSNARVIE